MKEEPAEVTATLVTTKNAELLAAISGLDVLALKVSIGWVLIRESNYKHYLIPRSDYTQLYPFVVLKTTMLDN